MGVNCNFTGSSKSDTEADRQCRFSPLMILGAYITIVWVPNPCDIYGESKSLEDLSKGKQERKIMEVKEKLDARRAEQARYGNV